MTFDDKPYLEAIYRDLSQKIVVRKSVQCGISEWAVCDCFRNAELGLNTLYVLPKYTLRNRFVKRIDKVISRSVYYRERIGDTDSLWQKRYCGADIIFASSETDSDFIEFPADCIIIDELDKCHQGNILLAPDRISASEYKLERKVSTPTHEDFGIDAEYKESDQKEWQIKCESCNEWQPLDFLVNVVSEIADKRYELLDKDWSEGSGKDIRVFCRKCNQLIDRLAKGEWVAQYQNKETSGYHINKLFSVQTTIAELWQAFQKGLANQTLLQIFYNSGLGLAHTAEGDKLSEAILNACVSEHPIQSQSKTPCYMGIDVGNLLHVVITDGQKVIFIGIRSTAKECATLIEQFKVKSCVIDMRPETRWAKDIQDAHKGKVLLCEYIDSDETRRRVNVVDRQKGKVQSHRTQSIDSMVAKLLNSEMKLPKNAKSIPDFFDQMTKSVRILEETARGLEARWSKGIDHYFHAMNYVVIAQSIFKSLLMSF